MTDRNYIDMLTYMRPEGSKYQRKFCNRYLMPVFGQPDKHGNYTHIVGDKPRVAFMAHHAVALMSLQPACRASLSLA